MKAVRIHLRGGPEGLVYEDSPTPHVGAGEALIRVYAAAITPTEFTWNSTWTTRDGKARTPIIPGFDVSGIVEAVSPDVSDLAVGDAVYGLLDFWRDGAAAEYVVARAGEMAPKPKSLDHVKAAAVPLSGLTAWQALFDHAGMKTGDRVLIHGAAGGVGTFAVQFANWSGAQVIATASQPNATLLHDLGADEVVDRTSVRFEDHVRNVDIVLDTIGGETLERSWGILRRNGVLVTIAGDTPEDKARKYGVRGVSILVQPSRVQLAQISQLIDAGIIRPIVEAVYPLAQAREAYERGLLGHNRGKLVLRVIG